MCCCGKNSMQYGCLHFYLSNPMQNVFCVPFYPEMYSKGDSGRCTATSQADKLQSHATPLPTTPHPTWGMTGWRCSNKVLRNLSALCFFSLLTFSQSLFPHFSFIRSVESELLFFNSSIKLSADAPCPQGNTAFSLGSPGSLAFSWIWGVGSASF